MKSLILIVSVLLISCNPNKEVKAGSLDENKSKLFELLKKLANDTNKRTYDISYTNDVGEMQVLDSAMMKNLSDQFDFTENGKKQPFDETFGINTYILDYIDHKNFVFLSAQTQGEDHKSLYFISLPKQDRNANFCLVGDAGYDEFQFMSYLSGHKINADSYEFSLINTNFDFPEGIEQGKEYTAEKDSVSFNIGIDATGKFIKKGIDSVRTVEKIKMPIYEPEVE